MAQRVQVLLTDDLDGGEATETVSFALDGTAYEIDLSTANAKQLRTDLGPWAEHARRAGTQTTGNGTTKRRSRPARERTADIRRWARDEKHYGVSDRGRLSPAIVAEYDAAHA
jgi:hypothetical protein